MFLNNKLFNDDICNGTIGIITNIINDTNVEVTFPTFTSINKVIVQKEFQIDGKRASRQQFLPQNAFALTAHKVKGLTLPHVTTSIDETVFAEGQVYVTYDECWYASEYEVIVVDLCEGVTQEGK